MIVVKEQDGSLTVTSSAWKMNEWRRYLSISRRILNHYETLNLSASATPQQIKTAFYTLSKEYHPDKNDSPDAKRVYQSITEAYSILGDAPSRRNYDRQMDSTPITPYGYPSNAGLDNRRRQRANYAWTQQGKHQAQQRSNWKKYQQESSYFNDSARSHAWWTDIYQRRSRPGKREDGSVDNKFLKDSTFWRYMHTFSLFGLLFGFAGLLRYGSEASPAQKKTGNRADNSALSLEDK
ncbi:DnaJ-like protein subfamily B member 9 [Wallemia ichthyophaga EXF-994]|uniref:DnaJ-like protein subfamily B member 9 n=1 Tax=Wallemia ichthyophaga (strain EXF-994 / CBS 113033) TaxID=1299270 RepID=R9ANX1_WALI9|nr:DnaJ-like protein subfamily B member 9 [Wallemia ichthyophaga EXF-994]EOR03740.1 DnaJ-like protein subfamily B member 9 [Wallemia ichthyophaga EXF-994]TIB28729.1 hypothetical protein E3P84_03961 [Wallemia ichthyophaga]TIB38475.1 hypothetical protein E3P83_03963 [Wallemia ichthyophaga]